MSFRRAPHGACELKWLYYTLFSVICQVAPRMGRVSWNLFIFQCSYLQKGVAPRMGRVSWNFYLFLNFLLTLGRAPHGACELKCILLKFCLIICISRAPHGACELKFLFTFYIASIGWVAPRMGRVSWNMQAVYIIASFKLSRPAWGVWVEICYYHHKHDPKLHVAPRMGRVSWNFKPFLPFTAC